MNLKSIRVLLVDANPSQGDELRSQLGQVPDVKIVGIAHSQRAALNQVGKTQPDLILVDLMLPGYSSVDLISQVSATHPDIRFLAVSPGDIPHDRVILSIRAGALGFITRDAELGEFAKAIQAVHQGEHCLPLEETYTVLGDAADELTVTAQERRGHLSEMILGLIPLTGILAAITAFLWREYWGQIGVRVTDLGIDPTTRMIDVLAVLLIVIGIFGPLLFVKSWVQAIGEWIEKDHPSIAKMVAKARAWRLGRLVLNHWVARTLLALLLLSFFTWLTWINDLIMVVFWGPVVGVILLANILDLYQNLPDTLHLPHLSTRRMITFLAVVIIAFLLILGTEVRVQGPDLRTDGLHGYLAPEVLGFRARPVILYDLDEKFEPLGALYLGGNADLYVLYDPCAETVRMVPVGSSRVELVDQVTCPSH